MVKSDMLIPSPVLKSLKFFVVTLLSIIYLVYIYNAWLKYDKGQVGMSISMQSNTRIDLPDLSICVQLPSKVSEEMEQEGKKVVVNILDNEEFSSSRNTKGNSDPLNNTEHPIWSSKRKTFPNGDDSDLSCHTISFDKDYLMESGSRNGVFVLIDASKLPSQIFHFIMSSPEDSIRLKMESVPLAAISFKGSLEGLKSLRYISMDIERLVTLNSESEPCLEKQHDEQEENYHRCLWHYYNKYKCIFDGFFDDMENNTKPCTDFQNKRIVPEIIRQMSKSPKETNYVTGCQEPCTKTFYKRTVGEPQSIHMHETKHLYTDIIYFYIPTSTITIKEQFFVYDLMSFAGDCGGMGGILLGLSLLTGYQTLLEVLQWGISAFAYGSNS